MNKQEAIKILEQELTEYRPKPYSQLCEIIDSEPVTKEVKAPNGTAYQIEIMVHWDDKPGGDIRVSGSVDDGGWRAFLPLTSGFIKAPNNTFIDE